MPTNFYSFLASEIPAPLYTQNKANKPVHLNCISSNLEMFLWPGHKKPVGAPPPAPVET